MKSSSQKYAHRRGKSNGLHLVLILPQGCPVSSHRSPEWGSCWGTCRCFTSALAFSSSRVTCSAARPPLCRQDCQAVLPSRWPHDSACTWHRNNGHPQLQAGDDLRPFPGKIPLPLSSSADSGAICDWFEVHIDAAMKNIENIMNHLLWGLLSYLRVFFLIIWLDHTHPVSKLFPGLLLAVLRAHGTGPRHLWCC